MYTLDEFEEGKVLLIDKPLEWTSFQVVNKLRWHIKKTFNIKKIKVGHAGTLDPLATGLLIICTGKFTKKIHKYQAQTKEYIGKITLGATTPSFDLETEINQTFSTKHLTNELIHKTTKQFTGEIRQKPPIFSAVKKDGKRLYELARKGKTTQINYRTVIIHQFKITNINLPNVDFKITCSKGTYIRSIANDFGSALHSGGHLSALRRTKIGNFNIADAIEPLEFVNNLQKKNFI